MTVARFMAAIAATLLVSTPAMATDPPATDVTVAGLRAGLTKVRGGDRNGEVGTVGVSFTHVGFGLEGPVSVRVINTAALAGGAAGIEGGMAQAFAGGVRAPFGKTHGLVARGGLEFAFFGNKYLWDSMLEFPQVQLGYQWLVPRSVVDVAMKGGYVLLGRHNTGDAASQELDGSFEWGAIGALHIGAFDVRASHTRVLVRGGGAPFDLVEAAFCGHASPVPIVLCTDVRYELGDVRLLDQSLRAAVVSYVGLTVGIVLFANEAKRPMPAGRK